MAAASSSALDQPQPGVADIGSRGGGAASSVSAGQSPINELNRSLEANPDPTHRYVQLATVRSDGRPACRTCVFRGFTPSDLPGLPSCALQFTTDTRSEKCGQLATNPAVEACWWFPASQEQYRIQGTLRLVTVEYSEDSDNEEEKALAKARRIMWARMSPRARLSWLWPAPKSQREDDTSPEQDEADYNPPLPAENEPAGRYPMATDPDSVTSTGTPLPTFALLLLLPTAVDHFQLSGFPQKRVVFTLRPQRTTEGTQSLAELDAWDRQRVSP
jgi:PPOX class probable FMN-dependent enzyme